eukprot:scaffold9099_cov127-Skeletonema_menzelii.AAC.1
MDTSCAHCVFSLAGKSTSADKAFAQQRAITCGSNADKSVRLDFKLLIIPDVSRTRSALGSALLLHKMINILQIVAYR